MSECRFTGSEPSPKGYGFCPEKTAIGIVKKGTDGNFWKVAVNKKGQRHWLKCSTCEDKIHRITFVDIPSYNTIIDSVSNNDRDESNNITLELDNPMYDSLKKSPHYMKRNDRYAALFGTPFDSDTYKLLGNIEGILGIVDTDKLKRSPTQEDIYDHDLHDEPTWQKISRMSKEFPGVMFIGRKNVSVYAHYDQQGRVNSILLDNGYYF